MKRLTKLTSVFLCVAMFMCAAMHMCVTFVNPSYAVNYGYYGDGPYPLPYPLCGSYIKDYHNNDYERVYEWKRFDYPDYCRKYTELGYLSSLWGSWYCIGDPEVWHEEYLERFETVLAGAYINRPAEVLYNGGTQLYEYRVDNYSWDNDTLSVQCSVDYNITYSCYTDIAESIYNPVLMGYAVEITGNYYPCVHLAITDKSDGSLIHMGKIKDSELHPEYKYGSNDYYQPEYPEFIDKDLWRIMDKDENINYTCTTTESFEVQMPYFYDSEKHDVTLYFRLFSEDYPFEDYYVDETDFYNPTILTRDDVPGPEPEPPVSSETKPPEPPVSSETKPPEPPEPEAFRGDANNDGVLNLSDVTVTLKYLAEWENIVIDEVLADVSGNGDITLADVSLMLQLIAGWSV